VINRRQFLKLSAAAGAGMFVPWTATRSGANPLGVQRAFAAPAVAVRSDPASQPKFVNPVPDALAPGFKYEPLKNNKNKVAYAVGVGMTQQYTGLVYNGAQVPTPLFGYGQGGTYTWPGKTFEVRSGQKAEVRWENNLFGINQHLLPVDTSLHWAYSLHGYEQYNIAADGIPVVVHLHGGHTRFQFDGNPEYFFSPGFGVRGPRWMDEKYSYDNDQPAGNLWYHDHALGITRLNVYAGMAGFYFVRDDVDTGLEDNELGLPAWPYEKAYAIQDRMFWASGELFYPAFPGDPFYDDFITGEGADLPPEIFPGGGPTALAEFFGDHMVVNGKIWPKEDVQPRNYRLRLLNGTDSRFLVIQFRPVPAGATTLDGAGDAIPFYVIGSDQGLASSATQVTRLVLEPGARYDVVFDFKGLQGQRIIMENIGGDEPFGGDIPGPQVFSETDRVMAFDVVAALDQPDAFNPANIGVYSGNANPVTRVRKVALFEGKDEYGRLQPLLGTAEPATDHLGNPINWPATPEYAAAGLVGQMQGAIPWHSPTTENPAMGETEIWEIYNATGDAHPVHLHLVNFQVGTGDEATYGPTRQAFEANVVNQAVVQHNGASGNGFRLENIQLGAAADVSSFDGYVENAPKDMVTALPGQVTRIKATFDRPGRYVWHCHILSHEDHEMMRVLHVGEGA
jgi:FtsP/CotA-like multicopper oxidase with cupredoxin domain